MPVQTICRVPPQDTDAEKTIIGTCLSGSRHIVTAIDKIEADDFYHAAHSKIFDVVSDLYRQGISVDLISVADVLRNKNKLDETGGVAYLSSLSGVVPVSLSNHCHIVLNAKIKRDVISKFSGIIEEAYNGTDSNDLLDMISDTTLSLRSNDKNEPSLISDLIPEVFKAIEERQKNKNTVTGITTGLIDLDSHMGGLQKSNLIIVAARPGMGKTAMALKFINAAAKSGVASFIFSLEMKDIRLAQRLLSMESKVPGKRLNNGFLADEDWPKITRACGNLSSRTIIIDDSSGLSVVEVTARAKKQALKHDIGLIVLDYIQLAKGTGRGENRARELSEISSGLLALGKDLNVPVVVLSQLNRDCEKRTDKRPMVSDIKESGSIEQDADVVLLLYRDEVYNKNEDNPNRGIAEIIVGKGRDIGQRTIKVGFEGGITDFYNLTQ